MLHPGIAGWMASLAGPSGNSRPRQGLFNDRDQALIGNRDQFRFPTPRKAPEIAKMPPPVSEASSFTAAGFRQLTQSVVATCPWHPVDSRIQTNGSS